MSQKGSQEFGPLTGARLAFARAAIWTAWSGGLLVLIICLRREHPMRVYFAGARATVMPVQLASLRRASGPRFDAPEMLARKGVPVVALVTATVSPFALLLPLSLFL